MIDTVKTEKSAPANRTPREAATPKLMAGAIFGLVFGFLLQKGGDLGKVLLPDLLSLPRGVFMVGFAAALSAFLVVLEQFTTR